MNKTHYLGNGWIATLADDGSMIVSNPNEKSEILLEPDSVDRLRAIFKQAEDSVLFAGIQARDNAVEVCGPQTGHTVRAIAFCDTPKTAQLIVGAVRDKYSDTN